MLAEKGFETIEGDDSLEHSLVGVQHSIGVMPVEAEVLVQQALQLPHEVAHEHQHLLLPQQTDSSGESDMCSQVSDGSNWCAFQLPYEVAHDRRHLLLPNRTHTKWMIHAGNKTSDAQTMHDTAGA